MIWVQSFDTKNIIIYKIRQSFFIAIFNKALSKDNIPNRIFKSIIDLIFPYLYVIFNIYLLIDYYFNYFYFSITSFFQNLEKSNYIIAKAY